MNRWSAVGALCLVSACVTTGKQRPVWVDPKTEVEVLDASGARTDGERLAASIWNDAPSPAEIQRLEAALREAPQDPTPGASDQDPQQDPETIAAQRQREAMIRATFGDAVTIGADGRLTKMYAISQAAGDVFTTMARPWDPNDPRKEIDAGKSWNAPYGGSDRDSTVIDRILGGDHVIEVVYVPQFAPVRNLDPPANPNAVAKPSSATEAGALVIVSAQPSSLAAFERALDLFYTNIPQIEIAVKVVEYSTADTISFGVDPVSDPNDPPSPTVIGQSSGKLIQNITANFPLSAPFIGASSISDIGSFRLGGIHDSWEIDLYLQALETNSAVDILSQPKLVVRNGGLATVRTTTSQPFPKAKISTAGNVVETGVEFKDTGVVMTIKPEVAGTDTVTLLVHADVSAVTSFAGTDPIPTPIISSRSATTSVHLREGETMVIGGLVTQQTIDSESKIPLLGDIPILGFLFRSTSTQKQKTVLEFHITPTIVRSTGG